MAFSVTITPSEFVPLLVFFGPPFVLYLAVKFQWLRYFESAKDSSGFDLKELKEKILLLGIASRDDLLTHHANMLDGITSREYQTRFGLSKTWWRDKNDPALQSLKPTKQAANQHTKAGRSTAKP